MVTLYHQFCSKLCPLRVKPAAQTGSSSNLSIPASNEHREGTMRSWGNNSVLQQCLKDILPVDAHVKAPKSLLQITEHTHVSLGIKLILLIERSCVHGMNAFHWFFLRMNLFLVQHNHNYTSENRILVTSRCSGLRAKQHELAQHIAYQGYCNTDENAGCLFSVVSRTQSQLFLYYQLLQAKSSKL